MRPTTAVVVTNDEVDAVSTSETAGEEDNVAPEDGTDTHIDINPDFAKAAQ